MKNCEPRLFSMMRTLMQLAHNPGSCMRRCESDNAHLSLRVTRAV